MTLQEFLDPTNPAADEFGEYCMLFELAYDTEPGTHCLPRFLNQTPEERMTGRRLLAATVEDNVILQLQCLGLGTPEWMMAGAPDQVTFDRWLTAGLLNGQTGI